MAACRVRVGDGVGRRLAARAEAMKQRQDQKQTQQTQASHSYSSAATAGKAVPSARQVLDPRTIPGAGLLCHRAAEVAHRAGAVVRHSVLARTAVCTCAACAHLCDRTRAFVRGNDQGCTPLERQVRVATTMHTVH